MKILLHISILLFLFFGCKKEEELLRGTITGQVDLEDQFCSPAPDQSGTKVMLLKETDPMDSTFTDSKGLYSFDNIPYGKYSITAKKDLFLGSRYDNSFYHIGGYSPTLKNIYMYEIPTYLLDLDSVSFATEYLLVYLKLNGDTLLPVSPCGMPLRVFASNSPDVDRYNFVSSGKAFLSNYYPGDYPHVTALHANMHEWEVDENFEQLKEGTIYLRIYPLAVGQGYWIYEYYPEALGPPSDVISFVWDDVVPGNR